ncbi:MAG TPA: XRE family transcriptional regulator [Verrucomicrobiae bacterium]
MATIGQRLKAIREEQGASLRRLAETLREDHTVLQRIENGLRYPPKKRLKKYARYLGLTEQQLSTLISVEKAGLNAEELIPGIEEPNLSFKQIKRRAETVLDRHIKVTGRVIQFPLAVKEIASSVFELESDYLDFKVESVRGNRGEELYACLYPNGSYFKRRDGLILINKGTIRGKAISESEQRVSHAHELGHMALHCDRTRKTQLSFRFSSGPSFCSSMHFAVERAVGSRRESQATKFAAAILIPEFELKKVMQHSRSFIAAYFGVSPEFLEYRLDLDER